MPALDHCLRRHQALLLAFCSLVVALPAAAPTSASPLPVQRKAAAKPNPVAPPALSAQEYADRGLARFYSGEYEEGRDLYRKAVELAPDNALFWAGIADCDLFRLLLAAGRLDAQLYGESNEFLNLNPPEPDPAIVAEMRDALARTRRLSEQQIAANPDNPQAHYTLGLSYALEANYDFSLLRKYWESLRLSSRAKDQHELVRKLDPSNHDANLVIGVYEYALGSVPAAVRWVLYFAGYSGSKERGIQLIQDTMWHGNRNVPAAISMLGLVYAREKMYARSREMFQKMFVLYPESYLIEMQIAGDYVRERNLAAAVETDQDVARKMEARAPGFDRVPGDRLYFEIGSLLERLGRDNEALDAYRKLLALKQKIVALQARSELRMGDIYRKQGQTAPARQMYEDARKLPVPEVQREANARLRSLKDQRDR